MWTMIIVVFMYSMIFITVYGICVSIGINFLLVKMNIKEKWVVVGFLHIIFGIIPGLIGKNLPFILMGGSSALFFFLLEEGIRRYSHKRKSIIMLSIIPIIIVSISYGLYHPYWKMKDSKITASEAIKFAESGKGFYAAQFPSESNQKKELYIEGYKVIRYIETEKIEPSKVEIKFIEEWEKGEIKGQQVMKSIVESRYGGMSTGGSQISGDKPPYKDNSYNVM
ncbi:hypothetical protein A8708_29040 [Paenibacillus oryzisoli]|uniref:Uncharacterized protein n=2 Tax=Paenibacillus oryzisoli TaxID=1850517 RepID=A0A198AC77_9BACL|nr:hypothetical protein A8708_29040 [Paenibacillus oryzisoli]